MLKNKHILTLLLFSLIPLSVLSQKKLPKITLKNAHNQPVPFEEVGRESIAVINFWATWCAPCIEELDALNDAMESLSEKNNYTFYIVSIDDNRTVNKVNAFVNSHDWNFELVFDRNHTLKKALNIVNVPYTVVVENQQIVYTHAGYYPGYENELIDFIHQLITNKKL